MLAELAALSGKPSVEVRDLVADAGLACSYCVSRVPTTCRDAAARRAWALAVGTTGGQRRTT